MRVLLLTFTFLLTTGLYAQEFPDFEAELQAMENNNLQTEELQMRQADAVTDVITDDVSTGQAGLEKMSSTNTDTDETILMTKAQKERARRIRSRP